MLNGSINCGRGITHRDKIHGIRGTGKLHRGWLIDIVIRQFRPDFLANVVHIFAESGAVRTCKIDQFKNTVVGFAVCRHPAMANVQRLLLNIR